jgi:hypothetical protein
MCYCSSRPVDVASYKLTAQRALLYNCAHTALTVRSTSSATINDVVSYIRIGKRLVYMCSSTLNCYTTMLEVDISILPWHRLKLALSCLQHGSVQLLLLKQSNIRYTYHQIACRVTVT